MSLPVVNFYFALLLSLVFVEVSAKKFGCLNGKGKRVDWWVIYKEFGGENYIYLDSERVKKGSGVQGLIRNLNITDRHTSPLVRTVLSTGFPNIQNSRNSPFYLTWNDQKGESIQSKSSFAHAKGFMGLKNTRQGLVDSFFIQHSLPRFPLPKSQSIFDQNIKRRAQHFFCFSLQDKVEQNHEKKVIPLSSSVKKCNFFKLLWHYCRTVNVNFYYDSAFEKLNSFRSIAPFEEILKSIPNFSTHRAAGGNEIFPPINPLASFFIESTGDKDTRLNLQIIAKAPNNNIDIYDDVTALLSIHHKDYKVGLGSDIKTGHVDKKSAMLMIAQSHVDPATLGINQKTLVDREGFYATVHVLNSSEIELPNEDGTTKHVKSMYRDHSKWSVNVIYGIEGSFPALLCFYDLNRSTKQASRGGAAFCLNSSLTESSRSSMALWEMFMSLKPKPTTMARFNEANIPTILDQIIPKTENLNLDLDLDLEEKKGKEQEKGFTRSGAFKKRKLFIDTISPITPLLFDRSVQLPKVEHFDFESESSQLHVLTNQGAEEIIVPCPYKYRDSQVEIEPETVNLPSRVICYILNKFERYGIVALNSAISRFGFEIREFSHPATLATPQQVFGFSNSRHMDYTNNTLLVNNKRPSLNELNETSENGLYDTAYSYLIGNNKDFSDDEKENSSEMELEMDAI